MKRANRFVLFFSILMLFFFAVTAQSSFSYQTDKALLKTIQQNLKDADAQYKYLMAHLPPDSFPKTFYPTTNKYGFSNSSWWCSGFYPGTLLNLYEASKDAALNKEALRMLALLKGEQFNTGTHDLGFMMYCSFGTANRLQPDDNYKQVLLNSAKSLSTRFNATTGCIKSWNSKNPNDFLVIIDNMMNLELLFWATQVSGDSSFYKIAVTHANTTMKNHFRPDYSSYHVVNYNAETGAVQEKKTAQGFANESAWARGQAWGLYGYTVMYRATKDKKYLDQANHIAHYLLTNPNLPADKIPYWDFNAPGMPNVLRDASAACIMASALIELSGYAGTANAKEYMPVVETILRNLSKPPYKAAGGANGGFLIQHCVGHLPAGSEVDVPLTYADYYFVEAMKRYKALAG